MLRLYGYMLTGWIFMILATLIGLMGSLLRPPRTDLGSIIIIFALAIGAYGTTKLLQGLVCKS